MIFVTVGSQKFPFERLLKKVDRLIQSRVITEEVLMQTGISDYVPSCPYQAFYERDAFAGHLERCDVLITHGGAGTMVRAVRQGKKTIVVPRLARYGEHVDDHQLELAKQFQKMNLLCVCLDMDLLPKALQTVRTRQYDSFPSNTESFIASLDGFLGSL
jgi:UDP-N-acetylglucosamine transferase subunit ALG13